MGAQSSKPQLGAWAFYALSVFSVIILRWKMPLAQRAYKTWGFPYTTLLFTGVAGWFLINTLTHDFRNAIIGIVLLLISLPFYFYWSRRTKSNSPVHDEFMNPDGINS